MGSVHRRRAMNVGALDLGSNSFGMLVGRVRKGGRVEKLAAHKETLRIGDVVAVHGALSDTVFERALDAVRDLADRAREEGAECVAAVGTSALRDAANGSDFVRCASERFGIGIHVASGDEEARLVYRGARSALDGVPERALVVDLGGGSAEIAVGDGDECLGVESLPLGFLRVARELELGATLNGAAVTQVATYVRVAAEPHVARLVAFEPRALVLSGGTARSLSRVATALGVRELSGVGLRRLATHLAGRDPSHLAVLGVEKTRAPVFGAGIVVLAALVELAGASSVFISQGGLREGIVLRETKSRGIATQRASMRTWAA
jgi:exopolyphosphatase/guanosine-5'-triphosphate,3'-diphosphate pyrophosphatase